MNQCYLEMYVINIKMLPKIEVQTLSYKYN